MYRKISLTECFYFIFELKLKVEGRLSTSPSLEASIGVAASPYTKATGCLFVCVSVPKDLANR